MFNPSQADVRRFFCGAFAKQRDAAPLDALETLAAICTPRQAGSPRPLSVSA